MKITLTIIFFQSHTKMCSPWNWSEPVLLFLFVSKTFAKVTLSLSLSLSLSPLSLSLSLSSQALSQQTPGRLHLCQPQTPLHSCHCLSVFTTQLPWAHLFLSPSVHRLLPKCCNYTFLFVCMFVWIGCEVTETIWRQTFLRKQTEKNWPKRQPVFCYIDIHYFFICKCDLTLIWAQWNPDNNFECNCNLSSFCVGKIVPKQFR